MSDTGIMILDKSHAGTILGILSILPIIVCIIFFYTQRGPNADIYFLITFFRISSIIGIILAAISSIMSKRRISKLLIGLIANLAVLVIAFLLLLAMGIGEA